jgi:hypothetical protein
MDIHHPFLAIFSHALHIMPRQRLHVGIRKAVVEKDKVAIAPQNHT